MTNSTFQSGNHWIRRAALALYSKIAKMVIIQSARGVSGPDQESEVLLAGALGLEIDSQRPHLRIQRRAVGEGDYRDEFQNVPAGGVCFFDFDESSAQSLHGEIRKMEQAGFQVDLIIYYGFFSWIFHLPLRLLGVRINPNKKQFYLLHQFYISLFNLELKLHPYVRFITGERCLVSVSHIPVSEKPEYDLSIVIPAFNERNRLPAYLDAIQSYMDDHYKRNGKLYEILVVDDGSSDDTSKVVKENYPDVKCIKLYKNFGKGGAVREGIRLAEGERILIADADGATPISELPRLEHWLDRGRDIAIGSRYLKDSKVVKKQSLIRRIISRLGNLLVRSILGLQFKDTQCGFKLFHRIPAKMVFKELRNFRFGFDMEVLKRAVDLNFYIEEVAVEWHDQEGSTFRLKATFNVLWELISIKYGYLIRFSIVGGLNTLIDFGFHNLLILFLGMGTNLTQAIYNGITFIIANLFSYLFNSGFTFRTRGSYIQFFIISFITFNLSIFSYYGLNVVFNPENSYILANLLKTSTILISLITNYFGYRMIVFKVKD